jgi:hypothetical protein
MVLQEQRATKSYLFDWRPHVSSKSAKILRETIFVLKVHWRVFLTTLWIMGFLQTVRSDFSNNTFFQQKTLYFKPTLRLLLTSSNKTEFDEINLLFQNKIITHFSSWHQRLWESVLFFLPDRVFFHCRYLQIY